MNKEELLESLKAKGFYHRIVQAFDKVPRENFVLKKYRKYSYEDCALEIGEEQTISQPYTIAFMLSLLEIRDGQKILEVGSGSGYVLALMSELGKDLEIYGVERVESLFERSQNHLADRKNIHIFEDGKELGLKKYAPYDRILVSASAKRVPESLLEQLSEDGILVIPVKNLIYKIQKTKSKFVGEGYGYFTFVPLIEEKDNFL